MNTPVDKLLVFNLLRMKPAILEVIIQTREKQRKKMSKEIVNMEHRGATAAALALASGRGIRCGLVVYLT